MKKSNGPAVENDRSKHSISIETFGQRKGQVRALAEFRNRKQRKRIEIAKALRKYKKTMKMEGFEAGTGAGRKRCHNEVVDDNQKSCPHKRQRANPFQKSLEKARMRKEDTAKLARTIEERQKEKEQKVKERKTQSKLLSTRTKRGQPIMKHTVQNMLKKLTKL